MSSILDDIRRWLKKPGRRRTFEYHRGFLVLDREFNLDLRELQSKVMDMAKAGQFDLVQKRHGDRDYSYLALRRRTGGKL